MSAGLIPFYAMVNQMKATDENGDGGYNDYLFVTADKKRNTGGEIKELRQAKVMGLKKQTTRTKHKERLAQTIARDTRAPHHYQNSTVNLVDAAGAVTKVHYRLILKFNNKTVIY